MGYEMHCSGLGDDGYFRASIFGMDILRSAMAASGVDVEKVKPREFGGAGENTQEGNILLCFSTNDAWWVEEEDCLEIARKLTSFDGNIPPEVVPGGPAAALARGLSGVPAQTGPLCDDDVTFVRDFAAFCEKASKAGGFIVC